MNEVSMGLHGRQLVVFVANEKIQALDQKLEFGKLVSVTSSLTAFQDSKTSLVRLMVF